MTINIPEVSVIIPCRNGGNYLIKQLHHLSHQVKHPSFEVIISDNGSTDGAPQRALDSFMGILTLTVVDSSQTAGISYARNIGAEHARGKYLLFCDADDYVEPEWISEIYAGFIENSADIVGGQLIHSKINSPDLLKSYGITEIIDDEPKRFTQADQLKPIFGYYPSVAGCNFGVTRQVYRGLGGMDLLFVGGSEETDFTWRVLENGGKIVFANKARVNYRLRSTLKGIFKQNFNYQKTKVLLWTRYRNKGMSGPSIKYSVVAILKHLPGIFRKESRLEAARIIGGNLGALTGIYRYLFKEKFIR